MMKEVKNNPGKAIKKYALITSKIILIAGTVYTLVYLSSIYVPMVVHQGYSIASNVVNCLILLAVIWLSVYLGMFLCGVVIYGFGDLVEKTAAIKDKMDSPKTMKLTAGTREATIQITNQQ